MHMSDVLRDRRVWSYRALWIGRWLGEEAPVTLALSPPAVTPLRKNEIMSRQHHPSMNEEPTLFASTRGS